MNLQYHAQPQQRLDSQSAGFLFSAAARIRHIRKHASFDDRCIFQSPINAFNQPADVLEQVMYLVHDVEQLRKEVNILRKQYETFSQANLSENIGDPYDELFRMEISQKIHDLQNVSRQLDQTKSQMLASFTDESKNELNAYLSEQLETKSRYDLGISKLNETIANNTEKSNEINKSSIKEDIEKNESKIQDLQNLLDELVNDEKELLEKHHKLTVLPEEEMRSFSLIQANLQKKLKSLQYASSQKKVEITKLQRIQMTQKHELNTIIKNKKLQSQNQRIRNRWYLRYQKKQEDLQKCDDADSVADSDATSVNFDIDNEEVVKIRVRRRHKHYHKKYADENQGNIIDFDDLEKNDFLINGRIPLQEDPVFPNQSNYLTDIDDL